MSILRQRQSIGGVLFGCISSLLLIAAIDGRRSGYSSVAEASGPNSLERKVDTLQANLKTLTSKLHASNQRIAELETMLDGVLVGTIPIGDADKLDGRDSSDFALASETAQPMVAGAGIVIEGGAISVDLDFLDAIYLSRSGGSVGPLAIGGDTTISGNTRLGFTAGVANAENAGTLRYNAPLGELEISDGFEWRTFQTLGGKH